MFKKNKKEISKQKTVKKVEPILKPKKVVKKVDSISKPQETKKFQVFNGKEMVREFNKKEVAISWANERGFNLKK